jgi:hypothetical protein
VTEPTPDQMRASDADRERVAQVLHNALSEGRLTIGELDERLTVVYAAKTLGDLKPVTADLPAAELTTTSSAAGRAIGGHAGSAMSIGIMSGVQRKGSWVLPPQHTSLAFWGGTELDLRSARFAEKSSTITAIALMGGTQIIVPDDINVDVTGFGLMGGFVLDDKAGTPPAPASAPTVRINGFAFWGGVQVKRVRRKAD